MGQTLYAVVLELYSGGASLAKITLAEIGGGGQQPLMNGTSLINSQHKR